MGAGGWGALSLLVVASIYVVWGAFPNPAFRISKLKGMTVPQVIARLGTPSGKAYAAPPGTSGGNLLTYYYEDMYRWPGFEYGVVFGNDVRVKYVVVGSK